MVQCQPATDVARMVQGATPDVAHTVQGGLVMHIAYMVQCTTATGVWDMACNGVVAGYFIVCVEDVLVIAPTLGVLTSMGIIKSLWEVKLVGIVVRDGYVAVLAVPELVCVSITL